MRTTVYSQVLEEVSQLATAQRAITADDARSIQVHLNRWAGEFWRSFWWPELKVVERRYFAPRYAAGTLYTKASQVYFPGAQAYYQATHDFVSGTNPAPASLSGGTWQTNGTHWSKLEEEYSAPEYSSSNNYTPGMLVYVPEFESFWHCFEDDASGQPFDPASWIEMPPFKRGIAYAETGKTVIGDVRKITKCDPRQYPDQPGIPFQLGTSVFVQTDLNSVWVEFLPPPPQWLGELWKAGTYASGTVVYYSGEWYEAKSSTSAAPTDAAAWRKLAFPTVLKNASVLAAYGDWLTGEGQTDKARAFIRDAFVRNNTEIERIERTQSTTTTITTTY